MSKCKHGHELTNNYYTRRVKNKLRRSCKTCAIIAANRARFHHPPSIDVLATNHAELERQLEHAMPWDRDDIKDRMVQISKQLGADARWGR